MALSLHLAVLAGAAATCSLPLVARAETEVSDSPSDDADAIDYDFDASLRLLGALVANDPDVAFVGRNDGFRIQHARLGVRAAWSDRVDLRLTAEGADDAREAPNAVRGTLRFALEDAYADVHLGQAATLRVARFAVLYDLEEYLPPNERGFARRALPSRGVRPTEGFETRGLGIGRDLGIAVRAERAIELGAFALGYEVAIQNGAGARASANENDRVALSAVAMASTEGAFVFFAARTNTRTQGELPALRTERDLGLAAGLHAATERVRGAAQVFFERTEFPTIDGPSRLAYGAYAQLLVSPIDDLELGYRYGILEPSDRVAASIVQEHTLGLNYAVAELPLRLQLNATRPVEEAGRSLRNDRLELVAEIAL